MIPVQRFPLYFDYGETEAQDSDGDSGSSETPAGTGCRAGLRTWSTLADGRQSLNSTDPCIRGRFLTQDATVHIWIIPRWAFTEAEK